MQRPRVAISLALSLLTVLFAGTAMAYADQGTIHEVRAGETLRDIALQHGITAQALINANRIGNPDMILVGQELVLPSVGPSQAKPAPPAKQQALHTYAVRSGDTLAQIAETLDVSVASLVAANRLADPDRIYPGMVLRTPGDGTSPGRGLVTDTRFIASISQQRCWLYKDGRLIGDWRCSSGRKEAPSAPGSYRIQSKVRDAYGSRWDFWMPYWLGLYYAGSTENGIHGLPYNKQTGRRTWEGLVGTPITFGCIMLDDADAKTLFDVAYVGMPVVIQP